jgi:hypothetical protein
VSIDVARQAGPVALSPTRAPLSSPRLNRPLAPTATLDATRGRALLDACTFCEKHPDAACFVCTKRRRAAWRYVRELGYSVEQCSQRMGLTPGFAADLLAEEADRREMESFKQTDVRNAALRLLFEARAREDPTLTAKELAVRAGLSSGTHVARLLGYQPTSGTVNKGRFYPPRLLSTISVDNAARLVRAMGYTPAELAHMGVVDAAGVEHTIEGL